jgi:CHAT domain-containing protein
VRKTVICFVFLLYLGVVAYAAQGQDTVSAAREAAAVVEDKASSDEERQAALSKLQEAVRLFTAADQFIEAAHTLNRVGRLQLQLNQAQASIYSHSQALNLLKQNPSSEIEVDNLNGLAAAYMRLQNHKSAKPALQLALTRSEQSGYTAGQAQALLTLSDLQNYGDHVLAVQTAQQALDLWRAINDQAGQARTYVQIGHYYMAQNKLFESKENAEAALAIWQQLQNKSGQAGVRIMMGFIEYRKGNWEDCIRYHSQARELLDEKAGPMRLGQIAVGLAEAFNEIGLPAIGQVHFEEALRYYRELQDPGFVAYALYGLGCSYYLQGNYSEATNYFRQSLAEISADSIQAAQCNENLGKVSIATGDYAAALTQLEDALATYTRTGNSKEAAQARALIGQVYQQQGITHRARDYYLRALAECSELSDQVNQSAIYYALGQLELSDRNYETAEQYLQKSIEVTENMRRVSTSSDLATAFSARVQERYNSYIECLMRKHAAQPLQGFAVRAFETSELSRARSLAELLRATQTNLAAGLDPQLAEQEKLLRQSLRVKEDYRVSLLGSAYKKEDLDALQREIAQLEAQYKQVVETIKTLYPAYDQLTRPTALSLQQIQEQVVADDQTVLLEYILGAKKSYVWAVTNTKLLSYELPSEAEIELATKKVHELLMDPLGPGRSAELSDATKRLSEMILTPVASELNKRRILIVADGALNYVPFQVLPAPSGANEPLVANYELVNAPSASILGQLKHEATLRQPAFGLLAMFGDPVFASNYAQFQGTNAGNQIAQLQTTENERWRSGVRDIEPGAEPLDAAKVEPLFYARRELSNLRNIAGEQTFSATGFSASREILERTDLTKYAILHFSTHGILDPIRPEKSGLLLSLININGQAQNGFIGLEDIYRLRTPVSLVVLSACRTGLGKDVRGEGLIGLTRGFMYAGASSVVASLWKVDDEATAELMKRFYINMLQGNMPPAAALRAAQNSIRQEPQWHSPYYWGAFILQGDYSQVIKAKAATADSARQLIIPGILAVILFALLYGSYRRMIIGLRSVNYSTLKK